MKRDQAVLAVLGLGATGVVAAAVFLMGTVAFLSSFSRTSRWPEMVFVPPQPVLFQPPPGPIRDDPAFRTSLQQFFDRLGSDWGIGDGDMVLAAIDVPKLMDECCRLGGLPPLTKPQRLRVVERFAVAERRKLIEGFAGWTHTTVTKIVPQGGADDAVVYTRLTDAGTNTQLRRRWWVRRGEGGWRVYDIEDLETDIRLSTVALSCVAGVLADDAAPWAGAGGFVMRTGKHLVNGDYAAADQELKQVEKLSLPKSAEAFRWMAKGIVAARRGQAGVALEHFHQAERHQPDLFMLTYHRAYAFNDLRDFTRALENTRKYLDLLGEDRDVCLEQGLALAGQGKRADAADAFRRALHFDPRAKMALDELRKVLAPDQKAELAGYVAEMAKTEEAYAWLADNALREGDAEGLTVLAEEMARLYPAHADPVYHLARARGMRQQLDQAVALYLRAMKMQPKDLSRQAYLRDLILDLRDAGQPLKAYGLARDRKEVFRILAQELRLDRNHDELRRLLDEHRRHAPNDPLLAYFAAALALDEQRYADADQLFARVAARHLNETQREELFRGRVLARYKLGKGLSAYADLQPKEKVFHELALLFVQDKRPDQLRELVRLHRQQVGNHDDLPVWEAEAAWLEKDHAALVDLLETNRHVLSDRRWSFKLQSRFFLSLYELGRHEDAVRAAARLTGGSDGWAMAQSIFGQLRAQKRKADAVHFATACHKSAPDDPRALTLLARAKVLAGQVADAVVHYQRGQQKQTDELHRRNQQTDFLLDMAEAGRWREAYEGALDARSAFATLAGKLLLRGDHGALRGLVDLHAAKHSDDVWLAFYRGELALADKDYACAHKHFADGAARYVGADHNRFRDRLLVANFHLKGAAAVYAEAGPTYDRFTQLAWLCNAPEHAKQLRELIALHRTHFPFDRQLPLWEVEVDWISRDYAKVVARLRQDRERLLADASLRWKFEDRLVRALLRLKRVEEARSELARTEKRMGENAFLRAVIAACAGDVSATGDYLRRVADEPFALQRCYEDPDLGPALRSAPFQTLREKYPPPQTRVP